MIRRLRWWASIVLVLGLAGTVAAAPGASEGARLGEGDALAALAGRGILGGVGDGTFKQCDTLGRYEVASVLARSLLREGQECAVPRTASDLDGLNGLVRRLSDELGVFGVRVASRPLPSTPTFYAFLRPDQAEQQGIIVSLPDVVLVATLPRTPVMRLAGPLAPTSPDRLPPGATPDRFWLLGTSSSPGAATRAALTEISVPAPARPPAPVAFWDRPLSPDDSAPDEFALEPVRVGPDNPGAHRLARRADDSATASGSAATSPREIVAAIHLATLAFSGPKRQTSKPASTVAESPQGAGLFAEFSCPDDHTGPYVAYQPRHSASALWSGRVSDGIDLGPRFIRREGGAHLDTLDLATPTWLPGKTSLVTAQNGFPGVLARESGLMPDSQEGYLLSLRWTPYTPEGNPRPGGLFADFGQMHRHEQLPAGDGSLARLPGAWLPSPLPGFADTVLHGWPVGVGTASALDPSLAGPAAGVGRLTSWSVGGHYRFEALRGLAVRVAFEDWRFRPGSGLSPFAGASEGQSDLDLKVASLSLALPLRDGLVLRGGYGWSSAAGRYDPTGLYPNFASDGNDGMIRTVNQTRSVPFLGLDCDVSENLNWNLRARWMQNRDTTLAPGGASVALPLSSTWRSVEVGSQVRITF